MPARIQTLFAGIALLLALTGCEVAAPSNPGPDPTPTATASPAPSTFLVDPRAANVALFDELASDLSTLTGASRQIRVDAFWPAVSENGGAPLHGEGRLVFAIHSSVDGWFVAGSFNTWSASATPLVRIAGTDTLIAEVAVAPGSRHEYKLVRAGVWSRDPEGRWVSFDGINTGTVGDFNSVAFAGAATPFDASELYLLPPFTSEALGNRRDVFVQVPSSYWPARGELPLLVMHDGNESLCRGRFDDVLDTARADGDAPAMLVAYVALALQTDRMDEYTFGTAGSRGLLYEAYIADELVPRVEALFATPGTPASRGVIGASLGGLISYRIGLDRPDVFGRTGGQSSSFFWNNDEILGDFQAASALGGRWYLDAGSDADNGTVTEEMKQILEGKGVSFRYVRDPLGEHDWSFWGPRLPGATSFLFGP